MTLEIQTAELSSADQIMIAVTHVYQAHGDDPPTRAVAAAVLAAAADQVVLMRPHGGRAWTVEQAVAYDALTNAFDLLNAIADDLRGQS
jgi:hypothetical protein